MKAKIVWLSANILGYKLLKEAQKAAKDEIAAIITLKKEAKTKMYDGIDSEKWREFGIPVYEIERINNEAELLKNLKPDFIITAGWRQMINEDILAIPLKGFVGFHPSFLPKGRGPAPIINTILLGLEESGITMFYLDKGTDSGDIIGQKKINVQKTDYAEDLYQKVIEGGGELIQKFLPLLIKNKAPRIPQDEKEATLFPKRSLVDNEIDIEKDSLDEIARKMKAFSKPYAGAYIKLGNKKIIIWRGETEEKFA